MRIPLSFASASSPASVFAALTVLVVASSRCAGTLADPGRFSDAGSTATSDAAAPDVDATLDAAPVATDGAASCPDVPTEVFVPSCTSAGCHNAQDKVQGLDLQSPGLVARLINVPSSEGKGLLIDPSTPAASVVYAKLTANPPFGARMPTKGALDDATIACVLAWVTEEASASSGTGDGGSLVESGSADAFVGDGHED